MIQYHAIGVIDGETGFVVEEGDLNKFVEKLSFLIDNVEIREMMGEKGRKFVQENFDIQILGSKLLKLYKLCL